MRYLTKTFKLTQLRIISKRMGYVINIIVWQDKKNLENGKTSKKNSQKFRVSKPLVKT